MDQLVVETKEGCIASAMKVIGSKWTALILRDLLVGPKGFCELEKSVGGVNPRTLSQRLHILEEEGIITQKPVKDGSSRTPYSLTKKGQDLWPILEQMAKWGSKYSCP